MKEIREYQRGDSCVYEFEHGGLKVELIQDTDIAHGPDEWGDEEVFIVTSQNRNFEVIPEGFEAMEIMENLDKEGMYDNEGSKYFVFPLNAYIHSGVSLSLGTSYPFDCPWDSGQIGVVLVKDFEKLVDPAKLASSVVDTWNMYLSGDVWGYDITHAESGASFDSLWGIYGFDYAKGEAEEAADRELERFNDSSVTAAIARTVELKVELAIAKASLDSLIES